MALAPTLALVSGHFHKRSAVTAAQPVLEKLMAPEFHAQRLLINGQPDGGDTRNWLES